MATTDPRVETIRLLTSIDITLKALLLVVSESRGQTSATRPSPPTVDLDGAHGDPVVKAKDPRDWTGPSMQGQRFSQCPPEYLDLLASRYDYFASKDGAEPKDIKYATLDAARARGWAARLRAGWTAPKHAEAAEDFAAQEPSW